MANVTDPLARTVHGTNPQNLIEYITRQKIYDSLYWKEECFGLSASDVATKAAELKAVGGTFGGNNKPTRFLCLALKLLQIQPDEGIVEEFIQNEDFKYVRALGAFYLRLTGRPAEIFELIEPLYNDFRKIRFRESTGWKLTHIDELAHELLTSDRYCGIALPHLPKRDVLLNSGYLEGPRCSALTALIDEQTGGDAEKFLEKLAENGNDAARVVMDERKKRKRELKEKEKKIEEQFRENSIIRDRDEKYSRYERDDSCERHGECNNSYRRDRYQDERYNDKKHINRDGRSTRDKEHRSREHKYIESKKKYGSLFKQDKPNQTHEKAQSKSGRTEGENTEEYWNEQRAKLGLKPLEK